MAPHIRSHRVPCSRLPKKASLQLSSQQSVGDVEITQLDWNLREFHRRGPAAAKKFCPYNC